MGICSLVIGQEFFLFLHISHGNLQILNDIYPDLVNQLLTGWPTVRSFQFLD